MATKAKQNDTVTAEVKTPTVNRNAVNAIVGTIVTGLTSVNGTGGLLAQVCKVGRTMYRGVAIPAHDIGAMLADLTIRMKWDTKKKPGAKSSAADQQRSRYKQVLTHYAVLPEAMDKFRKVTGTCTWHDGIALARLLNSNTIAQAVKKHSGRASAKNSQPTDAKSAKKTAAMKIKAVLKLPHLPKAFLQQLREICDEYSIDV